MRKPYARTHSSKEIDRRTCFETSIKRGALCAPPMRRTWFSRKIDRRVCFEKGDIQKNKRDSKDRRKLTTKKNHPHAPTYSQIHVNIRISAMLLKYLGGGAPVKPPTKRISFQRPCGVSLGLLGALLSSFSGLWKRPTIPRSRSVPQDIWCLLPEELSKHVSNFCYV